MVNVGYVPTGRPIWDTRGPQSQPESWYPNYPNDQVKVSLIDYHDGNWRVCIWGWDDFGLEQDLKDKALAQKLYDEIDHGITQAQLKARGFYRA
jgi:hypothetical protein